MPRNSTSMEDSDLITDTAELTTESAFVELLGRPTRVRILYVLAFAPDPLNPATIAEQADISRNAFYDNIGVLEEYGVVEQSGSAGNSPLYTFADGDLETAIRMVADHAGARRREIRDAD